MRVVLLLQGQELAGQGGLLTLKSVTRSDAGVYNCKATDFDNLDADLSGVITLVVNCEWLPRDSLLQTHRIHTYTHTHT